LNCARRTRALGACSFSVAAVAEPSAGAEAGWSEDIDVSPTTRTAAANFEKCDVLYIVVSSEDRVPV